MFALRFINKPQSKVALLAFATLLVIALALWFIDRAVRSTALDSAKTAGRGETEILAAGLQSELDKFSLVPLVLAEDPQVRALLSGTSGETSVLNSRLETLARQTDAAAIYLMDADGLTLSASNWRLSTSFIGSNYSFRRYFSDAIKHGSATQFALGTVSREPGLYIAQRVMAEKKPVGIVAVKVEFARLEANWKAATEGVFVTNRDGVVILTSNDSWRFHVTDLGDISSRDQVLDRRQFGIARLKPLVLGEAKPTGGLVAAPLLDTDQPIELDGWVLHLLTDPSPRIDAAVANVRFYSLLVTALVVGLIAFALLSRRRRELQAEATVRQRTQTLREQLNQANRLATLGQISAGVGHEINQPLAAARLFAENGKRLILTGKLGEAEANFTRISELTDRIGRITSELRRFSRRDALEPHTMPVANAVDGALLLLRERIDRIGTSLTVPDDEEMSVQVRAETVRLEQVLVNLIQNAVDASGTGGSIEITIAHTKDFCLLTVADNGPGLDPEMHDRMFQPFATTKSDGLGLGLVISREIMRDLGGDLLIEDSLFGARFVMRIPRA